MASNIKNTNTYANDTEIFYHKGKFYTIEKEKYETRESYLERTKFILDGIDKGKTFIELKKMSLLWINIKNIKCKYSEAIMIKIKEIDNSI